MEFKLNDYHRNIPEQELLDDLKTVALKLGKNNLTKAEYDIPGKYGSSTILRRFGRWNNALQKAGLEINLSLNISDKELFENIEEVWISLGRQPKYSEIKNHFQDIQQDHTKVDMEHGEKHLKLLWNLSTLTMTKIKKLKMEKSFLK